MATHFRVEATGLVKAVGGLSQLADEVAAVDVQSPVGRAAGAVGVSGIAAQCIEAGPRLARTVKVVAGALESMSRAAAATNANYLGVDASNASSFRGLTNRLDGSDATRSGRLLGPDSGAIPGVPAGFQPDPAGDWGVAGGSDVWAGAGAGRPTVPMLVSWQPGQLELAGVAVRRCADLLDGQADDLNAIRTGLKAVWSGEAADAAVKHTSGRIGEIEDLAAVVRTVASTLVRSGLALAPPRSSLLAALQAAAAAGCVVNDDGTVIPPVVSGVPTHFTGPVLAAMQRDYDVLVLAGAALAARLAAQIKLALDTAEQVDRQGRESLSRLVLPTISPPPQPLAPGFTSSPMDTSPLVAPGDMGGVNGGAASRRRSTLYNIVGGLGSAAYDMGPGALGDLVKLPPDGLSPSDVSETDDLKRKLQDWYAADRQSDAHRRADIALQIGSIVNPFTKLPKLGKEAAERLGGKADDAAGAGASRTPDDLSTAGLDAPDLLQLGVLGQFFKKGVHDEGNLFSPKERAIADWLAAHGADVRSRPADHTVHKKKNPDSIVRYGPTDPGTVTEFKTLERASSSAVKDRLFKAGKQLSEEGGAAIIDGRQAGLTREIAEQGWLRTLGQAKATGQAVPSQVVILLKDGSDLRLTSP